MPRLIVTEKTVLGLERCRRYLTDRAPDAARRAAKAIDRQIERLETTPDIGRPVSGHPGLRELLIRFGASGYVALYRHVPEDDTVILLAFRHQREAGS